MDRRLGYVVQNKSMVTHRQYRKVLLLRSFRKPWISRSSKQGLPAEKTSSKDYKFSKEAVESDFVEIFER